MVIARSVRLLVLALAACGGSSEVVYEEASNVLSLALAVDNGGRPHLAWGYSDDSYHLRYSGRTEDGWSAPIAPDTGDFSDSPLLGADQTGRLHLVYRRPLNAYLWRSADGTWSAPESAPADFWCTPGGMAVDPAGGVHLGYVTLGASSALYYAYRPPAGPFADPEMVSTESGWAAVAVDASGTVHLAHIQGNTVTLRRRESSGWSVPEVIATETQAQAFTVTPDGAWQLLFVNADKRIHHLGDPAHGWPAAGTAVSNPQDLGAVGGTMAFASDSDGELHAFWSFDQHKGDGQGGLNRLRHTHGNLASGWSGVEDLYASEDAASTSTIAVAGGPDGCVHLARREFHQVRYRKLCR